MKYIILVFIDLLLTLNLSAKTYEDGEDKKISRWETLSPTSIGTIKNKHDKLKNSRVIQLDGNGTKCGYMLKINANNKKNLFSWQMKYSEDFVIFISLETKLGQRYLIYTPGTKNGYMQYGLGSASISGTWQRYSRNLEDDLRYFDNRNSIVKVKSFVIRGSGSLDNIKIMKELNSKTIENVPEDSKEIDTKPLKSKKKSLKINKKTLKVKKRPLKIKKKSLKIKKRSLKINNNIKTNTTPTIIIEGENPFFLSLGESFEEPGVRAEDKEDGELVVTSSENIDKHKEGKYAVIYMATDSLGNSAIDKRYVVVGEENAESDVDNEDGILKEEHVEESNKSSVKSKEEDSDAQYRLEERELEIAEWERELQFREKEISQREKNLVK
jgi:hypothetical protein